MENLNKYLDFIKELEGLKSVTRTAWTKAGRHESTAEHSWRLAMSALVFGKEFPELNQGKIVAMSLVHDIGELYTGDIAAIDNSNPQLKENTERNEVTKIFSTLPKETSAELLSLWEEYSNASTPEAKFIKALDKAETILQHNQGANPDDFNYEFNLQYGKEYFEENSILRKLREILDVDTRHSMERNSP